MSGQNVQSEAKARFTGVVAFKNKAAAMSVRAFHLFFALGL
jgi:hypothetical protein